jgi:SAM-dependent methyltransferase
MTDYRPHGTIAGGFSPSNGTVDFYLRVSTFLHKEAVVIDLGAGRGGWYYLEKNLLVRRIRDIRPQVKSLIGVDIDPAVFSNPTTTENRIMQEGRIPVDDQSIDVVIADYVIEHIDDPIAFKAEIDRVLKPGGIFCARTPHLLNYVTVFARAIPNSYHTTFLRSTQPNRQDIDVFPTHYKMNTLSAIERLFLGWRSQSFIFGTDPSYFFGSEVIYRMLEICHRLMPRCLSGNLMIFLEKPE